MKFIKKHKVLIIVLIIIAVLIAVCSVFVVKSFSDKDPNAKYGNRLNGIDKVEITETRLKNVSEKLLDNKITKKANFNISGRIVKLFIEVKNDTDELSVQSLLTVILENFTEDEKSFYDFEVFITNESEKELYPMIAYKHRNNKAFTLSKKLGEKK